MNAYKRLIHQEVYSIFCVSCFSYKFVNYISRSGIKVHLIWRSGNVAIFSHCHLLREKNFILKKIKTKLLTRLLSSDTVYFKCL